MTENNYEDKWWVIENEDDMVVAIIKNQELAKKFQQENEKYGYCYDIKQDIETENKRYIGYYLTNVNGELQSVIDNENHYAHIHYKKVVGLLNQQDDKIKQLEKENERLKQKIKKLEQFEYKETETVEFKGNKLYIKDTHTELKMEENKMYITCQIPFNDGTPQIRKHKFGVVGIYPDWRCK